MKTAMSREFWDTKKNNLGGYVVDSGFDWYAFDLVRDKTGQTYAWGFKNAYGDWHVGESEDKTAKYDCPLYRAIENADKNSQESAKPVEYEIRFYDMGGHPLYILPFTLAYRIPIQ